MEHPLKATLLQCLLENSADQEKFLREFEIIAEQEGDSAFAELLQLLTHLQFSGEEARKNWGHILNHREQLYAQLGRPVDLLTAVCDYFSSVKKQLHAPKVIEIDAFEKTEGSSKFDSLTGLYNRSYFDEALTAEVNRALRYHTEFSLLFLDLDDFKRVNDNQGHQAGDAALSAFGKLVLQEKRAEDTAARYGGEEIVMILPETGKGRALVIGERIRRKLEMITISHRGSDFKITLSAGIATFPFDGNDAKSIVWSADQAMYVAKQNGKNNVALFSPDKRRFLRVDFYGEIKINLAEKKTQGAAGQGKNISQGGILFETKTRMELDDHVRIEIPGTLSDQPIVFVGDVVRMERIDDQRFEVGVSFLHLASDAKDQITQYLINQLSL